MMRVADEPMSASRLACQNVEAFVLWGVLYILPCLVILC